MNSVPGMVDSIQQVRQEGLDQASATRIGECTVSIMPNVFIRVNILRCRVFPTKCVVWSVEVYF